MRLQLRIAEAPPRGRFSGSRMVAVVASVVGNLSSGAGAAPEIIKVKVAAGGEGRYKVGGG